MVSKTNNTSKKNSNNLKYNVITRNESLKKWDENIIKSYVLGYREFKASKISHVLFGSWFQAIAPDKRMNA